MSKPRVTTGNYVQQGRFKLGSKLVDIPGLIEFQASETTTPPRQVTITMLRGLSLEDTVRRELLQSLSLLKTIPFPNFPALLEIDSTSAAPADDVWVFCNAKAGSSLSQILEDVSKKGMKLDPAFALYVVKSLCSVISTLHQCRVCDFKTIHGALSPESIWLDADGTVRCHNHTYGIAASYQSGQSLDETVDIRSLGALYWNLVTAKDWVNAQQANTPDLSAYTMKILDACGLWSNPGCSAVHELADLLDQIIAEGAFYATQTYASYWQREARQQKSRLLGERRFTPKKVETDRPAEKRTNSLLPPTPDAPRPGPPVHSPVSLNVRRDNTLVPWIIVIFCLLLAGAASVWYLLRKQHEQQQRISATSPTVAQSLNPNASVGQSRPDVTDSIPKSQSTTQPTKAQSSPSQVGPVKPPAKAPQEVETVNVLSINSDPESVVTLSEDGRAMRELGKSPLEAMRLPVGAYLQFVAEGRESLNRKVTVRDKDKPISVTLQPAQQQ
jgi:serine/threonine protein kinase